jgi:hypothetical protein
MSGLVLAGWRELVRKLAGNRRSDRQGWLVVSTEFSGPENFPSQSKDVYELYGKLVSYWGGER